MAVPTTQRETSQAGPPTPRFLPWLRKNASVVARPLFALILALIASGVLIFITAPGAIGDRWGAVLVSYQALWTGSFGTFDSISYMLVVVTPLLFASLSVAISFSSGLFNIGAAGQLIVGAMAADILALKAPTWPGWLLVPSMMLISIIAGGVWGAIVGFLKAWRGAHEVVTTIMLNWIAFSVTDYLIQQPFAAPGGTNESRPLPSQAELPAIVTVFNQIFGHFFSPLNPFEYPADVSLFLALLALVLYWFIIRRTAFGYEIRVLGKNPKAAVYAGIPARRNIVLVMAIAGAFAGLGGAVHLMGQPTYQLTTGAASADPTGFDAIGASLLGMNTPLGVLFGSLVFGGLRAASPQVEATTGIAGAGYIVQIMEALVLFSLASEFLPSVRRILPSWLRLLPSRPKTETVAAPALPVDDHETLPVDDELIEQSAGGDGASPKEN
jgi:general nucleoside transport system permease protein